jgi:hypothetical protein
MNQEEELNTKLELLSVSETNLEPPSLDPDDTPIDELLGELPVEATQPKEEEEDENENEEDEEDDQTTPIDERTEEQKQDENEEDEEDQTTPTDERTEEQKKEDEFWASQLPVFKEEETKEKWPPEPKEYIQAITTLLPENPTLVLEGMLKLFKMDHALNPLLQAKTLWKVVDALCVAQYRLLGFQALEKILEAQPDAFKHADRVKPFLLSRFAHETHPPLRRYAFRLLKKVHHPRVYRVPGVIQAIRLADLEADAWMLSCLLEMLEDDTEGCVAHIKEKEPGFVYDVLQYEAGSHPELVQKIASMLL